MSQVSLDLVFYKEKYVMGGIYRRDPGGYGFAKTAEPRPYCGGIAVFYCEAGCFTPEVLCLHGPNIARFLLAPGGQWWHFMG